MRRTVRLAVTTLFFCAAAASVRSADLPEFRPAVLGSKPDSLINTIDAKTLFAAGQREGAVMFSAHVLKDGRCVDAHTYKPAPDSQKLEEEVFNRLATTKVAPAIYDHQPVEVLLYGTVVFSVEENEPLVRIFLNQDPTELKKGSDFIGPQPIFGGESKFNGVEYPESATAVPVSGLVSLTLKLDEKGNLKELKALNEEPPLLGFGPAALNAFIGAKFIPAFRSGDPVDCDTILPVFFAIP